MFSGNPDIHIEKNTCLSGSIKGDPRWTERRGGVGPWETGLLTSVLYPLLDEDVYDRKL